MTERLYTTDSFLTEFDAVVTEIQELSRQQGQSLWRVALDRSAFYPTGGGQPHDTGSLLARARSGAELSAAIAEVEEDEHGEVWHHTAKPLLPGTAVHGAIDLPRRLDHIQQHSGQHLLSAAFLQLCHAPTVSFHLGETVSTIDLAVDAISNAALQQVEHLANTVIAEDRPVSVSTVSRTQAEAWLAAGELRKLPPRTGDIRIVEIAGTSTPFDRNACGGTHVRSTGQIGGLHLRGMEKVKQGWRVEFVCGQRAARMARNDFQILTETSRVLSATIAEIPESIRRMQAESKRAAKQLEADMAVLARYHAADLVRETPPEAGIRRVQQILSAAEFPSARYAKLLASHLTAKTENTMAAVAWQPADPSEPATIVLARSSGLTFDCGAWLRQALAACNGRGGGSPDMAQGSVAQQDLPNLLHGLWNSDPFLS